MTAIFTRESFLFCIMLLILTKRPQIKLVTGKIMSPEIIIVLCIAGIVCIALEVYLARRHPWSSWGCSPHLVNSSSLSAQH